MDQMNIDPKNKIGIKPDNVYDMLFSSAGQLKGNTNKKLVLSGEKFELLEAKGSNL